MRLSKKHGVNPSLSVCFWCEKEKNEIVLLGSLPGDKEAPRAAVFGYDPCDSCKGHMGMGITIIEAVTSPGMNNMLPIQKNPELYPTGKWWVVKSDSIHRMINDPEMRDSIVEKGKTFIEPDTAKLIGLYDQSEKK